MLRAFFLEVKMAKIYIEFTSAVSLPDHNGEEVFSAKEGEGMELEARSAERWIRRGLAVYADKPEAAPKKKGSK